MRWDVKVTWSFLPKFTVWDRLLRFDLFSSFSVIVNLINYMTCPLWVFWKSFHQFLNCFSQILFVSFFFQDGVFVFRNTTVVHWCWQTSFVSCHWKCRQGKILSADFGIWLYEHLSVITYYFCCRYLLIFTTDSSLWQKFPGAVLQSAFTTSVL